MARTSKAKLSASTRHGLALRGLAAAVAVTAVVVAVAEDGAVVVAVMAVEEETASNKSPNSTIDMYAKTGLRNFAARFIFI